MKVNERTVVGVDWPLRVPPTVERDRRACQLLSAITATASSVCQDLFSSLFSVSASDNQRYARHPTVTFADTLACRLIYNQQQHSPWSLKTAIQ